jgi:hypothetical protein
MVKACCAAVVLVCMTAYVWWLEFRLESTCIDKTRGEIYESLDTQCLKFLRRTKERPIWRLCWLCSVMSMFFLSTLYCLSPGFEGLGVCSFLLFSFSVSYFSAYSVLSYYTWHTMCPNYDCSNSRSCENVMSEDKLPP